MIIEIPAGLKIATIKAEALPVGWREFTAYSKYQDLGNEWLDRGEKPVLKVPSAVLPGEFNHAINATHADFKQIKLLETAELAPDERIEQILKHYRKK